jgi:hypothetical protein
LILSLSVAWGDAFFHGGQGATTHAKPMATMAATIHGN